MLPSELTPNQFKNYPPQARHLAIQSLTLLQQLPLPLAPILLREIITYDWKFPAEQRDLANQLDYLASLSPSALRHFLADFTGLRLSSELERTDWVDRPADYSAQLAAYLWSSHQIDAFRAAAEEFTQRVEGATPDERPATSRLVIVVLGQGVAENHYPLFRKLRGHGVYFNRIEPEAGLRILLETVAARAKSHSVPYGHWYIDGGTTEIIPAGGITSVSYNSLDSVRDALLKRMNNALQSGIGGPEAMRTMLTGLRPEDLGLVGSGEEAVLNHFKVSVLTDGSGTQFFSTTFVQWAVREALRRAQPLTLLARYAPRQRQRAMNELISGAQGIAALDPQGSLIDADMGAYLTWVNAQRLADAERSSLLLWFEDHGEALAIAPSLPRGTVSSSAFDLRALLGQII